MSGGDIRVLGVDQLDCALFDGDPCAFIRIHKADQDQTKGRRNA
jgi:hypothetical protein